MDKLEKLLEEKIQHAKDDINYEPEAFERIKLYGELEAYIDALALYRILKLRKEI